MRVIFFIIMAAILCGFTYGAINNPFTGKPDMAATKATTSDLSDYSTGTWTPILTFATPGDLSVTYSTQAGFYTQIGNIVIASFAIKTSAFTWSTASGNLEITGLPFASASTASKIARGAVQWQGITKANYTNMVIQNVVSASYLVVVGSGSGQASANIQSTDVPSGGSPAFQGTIIYYTS